MRAIRNGVEIWLDTPPDLTIGQPIDGWLFVSQGFGVRSVTGSVHLGTDLVCGNVPARAVEKGRVRSTYPYGKDMPGLLSDGSPGGYGNTVLVEHETRSGFKYLSYYTHLLPNSLSVMAGDWVLKGEQVGITDTTGISTGNHIHFELRLDDVWVTRFESLMFINRIVADPEEDWYVALTEEGKAAVDAVFNDPKKREQLLYALGVAEGLAPAKPDATPQFVGSSLVTLGVDGRKAVELDGAALKEIHRAKKINPVTGKEEWDQEVLDSLQLQRIREQRQWLAANLPANGEPPSPGSPAQP